MFNYIEKLREKPEQTKKLVAIGVASLCVAVILVFWFFSVFPQFRQEKEISDRVQSVGPSPFSTITQILSQGTSGIGDELSKLKSLSSGFFGGTEIINSSTTTAAVSTTTDSKQ